MGLLYLYLLLNSEDLKLNEGHYRTASQMLKATLTWSSHENKQTRPIRVIVKRIHKSCTSDQIVQDLRQRRYKITDKVNILKYKIKEPLSVFMLTFDRTENFKKRAKSLILED